MRKRINLICATYMALIVCLIGLGWFLLYQQEQVIRECQNQITDLYNQEPARIVEFVQIPPEIVIETIYVDKPVDRIVEKVVIEEKEVEVIVYCNIYARNWESVEQFEQWYESQKFTGLMAPADCDDYSEWVQRKALQQGYAVSEAIAKNGLYCGVKVTKFGAGTGEKHAGNLVLIGNTYYWVEPQPDMFHIKRLFERD